MANSPSVAARRSDRTKPSTTQAITETYGIGSQSVLLHARDAGEAIVAELETREADVVLLTAERPTVRQRESVLPATTDYILKQARCPVMLIVPAADAHPHDSFDPSFAPASPATTGRAASLSTTSAEASNRSEAEAAEPGQLRVLVVDDEPQILRALQVKLTNEGYDVSTAATAADALALTAARNPDAVILDLLLPDGHGTDVCRQLRQWSRAPVLVLSAVSDEAEKSPPSTPAPTTTSQHPSASTSYSPGYAQRYAAPHPPPRR